VIADAGTNDLATFALADDGFVTLLDSVGTGQKATCWVARVDGTFYVSNAASGSVSGYQVGWDGQLALLGQTSTDPGTVDAAGSADGQFLYVQTGGNGIVDEFQINPDHSLTAIGSVKVANAAGGEGIVAF